MNGRIHPFLGYTVVVVVAVALLGCSKNDGGPGHSVKALDVAVSADRTLITFPDHDPGLSQFNMVEIQYETAVLPIDAPSRVAAVCSPGSGIIFETPELTSLYSQYRQGKSNLERAKNNARRTQMMFDNQSATIKDISDAKSDYENAASNTSEYEIRLKETGLDPKSLTRAKGNWAWVIADSEDQLLRNLKRNEPVHVHFSAFPEQSFHGVIEAIGEAVDPITRTAKIRIKLSNRNQMLKPGMFARVQFEITQPHQLVVPTEAVITVESKDYVFVEVKPHTFQRKQVVTQPTRSGYAILSGLESGQRVAVKGSMFLKTLSFGY